MKTFLGHAQAYGKAGKGPRAGEGKRTEQGKGKDKGKPKAPALTWDAVVAAHLQLLGADDETALALDPLLRAVLLKRDEIRRSVAPDVHPGAKAQRVLPGSNALPAAIDDYLRAFDAGRKAEGAQLEQGLAAYRAARKAQDAELAGLREQLREVLTVTQEAKLVAVGVLD